MQIEQQSIFYMKKITERKRDPICLSTNKAYSSYLKNWIIPRIGRVEIETFDNRVMRQFVEELALKNLSPSTIAGITNCAKDIIKSCQDENGNVLYPRVWNSDFIDAPIIEPNLQKAPIVDRQGLQEAIRRAPDEYKALYTLLAGTGLRISEGLALKSGKDNQINSFHIPEQRKLVIRDQFKHGRLQSPKTSAGVREIDLAPELNQLLLDESPLLGGFYFRNKSGGPANHATLYDLNEKIRIPGFHSLRRFRISHLRSTGCPEDIIKFWIGHSMNRDITDRYSKLASNIELRKQWAEKAGLGFSYERI
jgi:integrase